MQRMNQSLVMGSNKMGVNQLDEELLELHNEIIESRRENNLSVDPSDYAEENLIFSVNLIFDNTRKIGMRDEKICGKDMSKETLT